MQSDCVAQSSQAISLVFTEQSRIGGKNWCSKSQVSHLEASRNRLQKWRNSRVVHWRPKMWRRFWKTLEADVQASRSWLRCFQETCENLSKKRKFTKIDPVIQVRFTLLSCTMWNWHSSESMLNNGSLSWIVMSKGSDKCVDEVFEEKEVSFHDEEMTSGASIEKSIATKRQEQSNPPSNPPPRHS